MFTYCCFFFQERVVSIVEQFLAHVLWQDRSLDTENTPSIVVSLTLNFTLNHYFFINSRTAIAGAIIGLLLVFYNSKNLNCIGALSFFLRSVHTFS